MSTIQERYPELFAQIAESQRARQEKQRQAAMAEAAKEKPLVCRCGLQMIRRLGRGEYWCPICGIWERDL